MPIKAILLASRGKTPEKALLNLRVTHLKSDAKLTIRQAASRTLLAFVSGQGFGIPLVTLFTQIYQYQRIAKGQPVSYAENQARVFGTTLNSDRWVVAIGAGAVVLFLIALGQQAST